MADVDATGPPTRSRIEAFDQTAAVLNDSATRWRDQAQRLQQAADVYVDQVNTPNGTEWSGQTAGSYFDTAHADRLAVVPAVMHVQAMADTAEQGGENLRGAQQAALAAIAEAEADDFSVDEDLSVSDNYAWNSPTVRAVRQAAAVGHRNYIAYQAALLQAENQRIATQLSTGAAQMADMAPAHWRRPATEYAALPADTRATSPKDPVQAVDHHTWKQDPSSPVDPKNMTEAEARAAWAAVNAEIADYNARCGRVFILPSEKAAYDACVAAKGPLDDRQAAIRARLKDLGIPIEGEESAPQPAGEPPFPPPESINGMTEHGAEQVNSRDGHGVNDNAMQDAVQHPVTPPQFKVDEQGRGAYVYEGKDAVVVLNKEGQIVTAWPKNHSGWRHP